MYVEDKMKNFKAALLTQKFIMVIVSVIAIIGMTFVLSGCAKKSSKSVTSSANVVKKPTAESFNQVLAKKAYESLNPHHVGPKPNAVAVVGVPQIMAPALYKEYIVNHNPKHYYLLDVREQAAFKNMGHIAGAHNIPLQVLFTPKYLKMLPKHRTIISICYVGQWESMAAALLKVMGYHVMILRFGMSSWNPKIDLLHSNKVVFGIFLLVH